MVRQVFKLVYMQLRREVSHNGDPPPSATRTNSSVALRCQAFIEFVNLSKINFLFSNHLDFKFWPSEAESVERQ